MTKLDDFFEETLQEDCDFLINNGLGKAFKLIQDFKNKLEIAREEIDKYQASGGTYKFDPTVYDRTKLTKDSLKENLVPQEIQTSPISSKRAKRNAATAASKVISHQINLSSHQKLRCPRTLTGGDITQHNIYDLKVKQEKLSINQEENDDASKVIDQQEVNVIVKIEKEEMPAPTKMPPRKKGPKKQNIRNSVKDTENKKKDSDVILEEATVPVVDLSDNDSKAPQTQQRVTRSKVNSETKNASTFSAEPGVVASKKGRKNRKQKQSIKNRSNSDEGNMENDQNKLSKSASDQDNTIETEYGDAVSTIENENEAPVVESGKNATFCTTSPINKDLEERNLNATRVIEKPVCADENKVPADLMTDDESLKEDRQPLKTAPTVRTPKQVFSSYDHSPVKKKVEAFEKLAAATLPPRQTRTKTKAADNQKEQEETTEPEPKKGRYYTPAATKLVSKTIGTGTKAQSAVKMSQLEHKIRREKEEEAVKKREAVIQAQIEEKKRKRQEKELKVKQRAEALEKEKLKTLEIQRLKEERHKRIVQEQEEKRQKLKEELDKKRMLAKQKALEEHKKEEEKRKEEQEEIAKNKDKDREMIKLAAEKKMKKTYPKYMLEPTPLLPTYDCYDSDIEDPEPVRFIKPRWQTESYLRRTQVNMEAAGHKIKNTFFSCDVQTIDLKEIFETNDPRVLKRTSSANWTRPPKYSVLPTLCEQNYTTSDEEEGEDNED